VGWSCGLEWGGEGGGWGGRGGWSSGRCGEHGVYEGRRGRGSEVGDVGGWGKVGAQGGEGHTGEVSGVGWVDAEIGRRGGWWIVIEGLGVGWKRLGVVGDEGRARRLETNSGDGVEMRDVLKDNAGSVGESGGGGAPPHCLEGRPTSLIFFTYVRKAVTQGIVLNLNGNTLRPLAGSSEILKARYYRQTMGRN